MMDMNTITHAFANPNILNLALDILLIAGIGVLWVLWMRNSRRQQRLEALLAGTAQQLEEATRHLDEASRQMAEASKAAMATSANTPSRVATKVADSRQVSKTASSQTHSKRHTSAAAVRRAYQPQSPAPVEPAAGQAAQTSMILRMQREGETPASIADKLNLPLAQVRLMLKLQAATQQP